VLIYTLGILEKDSKLLFLLRQNTPFFSGHYGLPGGKVDPHESPVHALMREMHEELGIAITQNNLQFAHCLAFKSETDTEIVALIFNIVDWHGEPVNQEPHKCSELVWFAPDELPENTIPRHRHIVEMVGHNVLYSENGW
jgi:8-oxo-dGTP diphosphatase